MGAQAPLDLKRPWPLPLRGFSASTTLPFFVNSVRWLPIGTHLGRPSGRVVAACPTSRCASGGRTASRPSSGVAVTVRIVSSLPAGAPRLVRTRSPGGRSSGASCWDSTSTSVRSLHSRESCCDRSACCRRLVCRWIVAACLAGSDIRPREVASIRADGCAHICSHRHKLGITQLGRGAGEGLESSVMQQCGGRCPQPLGDTKHRLQRQVPLATLD